MSDLRAIWAGWLAVLVLGGCAGGWHELGDLQTLPQDLTAYVAPGSRERSLLPMDSQMRWLKDFRRRYLAPWQATWRGRSADDMFGPAASLLEQALYGPDLRPVAKATGQSWLALSAPASFPNADYPAITLRGVALRGLPTRQPAFLDVEQPGEGYPFDYLQYSSLPAGTPVRVRQRSADGVWLLVETDAVFGWLPATDVAPVDDELVRMYATSPWYVVDRDGVPLVDAGGQVLAVASLGSLWPKAGEHRVWVAMRGPDGRAAFREATLEAAVARAFPLPLTPGQLAEVGNRLLGQPYDWGGQFGSRDCSATLRDLFACFGFYLPRNSAAQAESGRWIDLEPLSMAQRERVIRERAIPWVTLAYLPGHIMLYIGERAGKPVFFHTLWGLKTRSPLGAEGRHLVGRTVITSLRPGQDLAALVRPEGLLAYRLKGLVLLDAPVRPMPLRDDAAY